MTIREATFIDAAAIAKVHVDSWRTMYPGIVPPHVLDSRSYERRANAWRRILSKPPNEEFVYVAEDVSGQMVGVASGGPERLGDEVYRGELYAIYLLVSYQRQGIGRRLVLAIVDRLEHLGIHSMLVWVLADNPSRGFYEALGGQVVRANSVTIGGVMLEEVAYGWEDTRVFLRA